MKLNDSDSSEGKALRNDLEKGKIQRRIKYVED